MYSRPAPDFFFLRGGGGCHLGIKKGVSKYLETVYNSDYGQSVTQINM